MQYSLNPIFKLKFMGQEKGYNIQDGIIRDVAAVVVAAAAGVVVVAAVAVTTACLILCHINSLISCKNKGSWVKRVANQVDVRNKLESIMSQKVFLCRINGAEQETLAPVVIQQMVME